MLQGFKQFLMRGNVVDMSAGIVVGIAFGAVVTALVKDLLPPLIAAAIVKPDFSGILFTLNGSRLHYPVDVGTRSRIGGIALVQPERRAR